MLPRSMGQLILLQDSAEFANELACPQIRDARAAKKIGEVYHTKDDSWWGGP